MTNEQMAIVIRALQGDAAAYWQHVVAQAMTSCMIRDALVVAFTVGWCVFWWRDFQDWRKNNLVQFWYEGVANKSVTPKINPDELGTFMSKLAEIRGSVSQLGAAGIGIAGGVAGLIASSAAVIDVLQIWIAPNAWAAQYLAKLLR